MEVRCASPFDLSQIAATLVRMHREAEFDLAPINSHTLMATVNNTIHNATNGMDDVSNNVFHGIYAFANH